MNQMNIHICATKNETKKENTDTEYDKMDQINFEDIIREIILNPNKKPKDLQKILTIFNIIWWDDETELFPIYQNEHWTIRWRDDHTVVPSSHHIILKIVGFKISLNTKGRDNWLRLAW